MRSFTHFLRGIASALHPLRPDQSANLSEAKAALDAVRQYQQAWLEHGTDRVHQFYEDPGKALDEIVE
jgi:hypothetical protein